MSAMSTLDQIEAEAAHELSFVVSRVMGESFLVVRFHDPENGEVVDREYHGPYDGLGQAMIAYGQDFMRRAVDCARRRSTRIH